MSHRFIPRRMLSVAGGVALAMLTVACSAPASSPTPTSTTVAAKPTTAAATNATPAVPSPAVPAASPAAPAASPAAAAPSDSSAVASSIRFVFEPGSSEMRYRARETFVDQPTLAEAVGATKQVSGSVVLTSDGRIVPEESKIAVDLSTLTSGRRLRDNFIKQNTLQTAQYPNAELVLRDVTDLLRPLPTAGADAFQLLGDLTVHGVTRPVQWDVQAQFTPEDV